MSEEKSSYLIDTIIDGATVLKMMMEELSPHRYYTLAELNKRLTQFSENKIYRIIKTLEHIGWVEKHPQQSAYKIGHDLLYLSHRYMRTLEQEHMRIRQEINSFR